MSPPSSASGGETRLALSAGLGCYFIWGFMPLVFQAVARHGPGAWEMTAQRTLWSVPLAALFVAMARQWRATAAVLRTPKVLGLLVLSAVLIATNWLIFIWAVNHGRVLETALGYYINPLINMAAGALLFRERIDRLGLAAICLAVAGVALQALAIGQLPLVSIVLALSFGAYGVVRKRVAADAQTGFLVECSLLAGPALAYVLWLEHAGRGHFLASPAAGAWLMFGGLITAVPLVLFAWAARRIPLSAMGFLQFIAPTIGFLTGVAQGEPLTRTRVLSFVFIWAGAALFIYGAWRRTRALPAQAA